MPVPDPLSSDPVVGTQIAQGGMPTRHERRIYGRALHRMPTFCKRSEDAFDYHVDLTGWLERDETVEAASAWCTQDQASGEGDLSIYRVTFGDTGALVWTINGADQGSAVISCRISTSGGRSILIRFRIKTEGTPSEIIVFGDDVTVIVGPL